MEKSITAGLEEYIRTIPGMKEIDAKQCSPLVLAYVGDCVYDLIIKTMVVGRGNRPVHRLHEETSQYVQASAQSFMMRSMQEHLNEFTGEEEMHDLCLRQRISQLQITEERQVLRH